MSALNQQGSHKYLKLLGLKLRLGCTKLESRLAGPSQACQIRTCEPFLWDRAKAPVSLQYAKAAHLAWGWASRCGLQRGLHESLLSSQLAINLLNSRQFNDQPKKASLATAKPAASY